MHIVPILQTSAHILEKSEEILAKDPHGIVMTLASIAIVFGVLTVLYLAYTILGMLFLHKSNKTKTTKSEEKVPDNVHDEESYIITIKRKELSSHRISSNPLIKQSELPQVRQNKELVAPLPGTITSIKVKIGDKIEAGQSVATLEAMKMENELESEYSGTVIAINVTEGDSVQEGVTIMTIE